MATQDTTDYSPDDPQWTDFFVHYEAFDAQRAKHKEGGLNDYSLLGSVLRMSDEVRLHSRFLYSMLNPAGPHYRGTDFGEALTSVLGHSNWLDWHKVRAYRERNYVDLYLTDGKRHLLIENKINAIDQPGQVRRYIDDLRRELLEADAPADPDDILVVYLSNGRGGPTHKSLEPYAVEGARIVDADRRKLTRFVNAHYRDHIAAWIDACLTSVQDIDNLRHAFLEYQHVVQRITKTYKSRVMNLEAFLLDPASQMDTQQRIRHAFEISRQVPGIKAKWLAQFFEEGLDGLLQNLLERNSLAAIPDAPVLAPFQFDRRHAKLFFTESGRSESKNKGRFWRLSSGPSSDSLALAVLFGASNLHIGVFPIRTVAGVVEFDDRQDTMQARKLTSNGQVFEMKRHGAINRIIPGLISWSSPLDVEIESLASIEGSRPQLFLEALLQQLLA